MFSTKQAKTTKTGTESASTPTSNLSQPTRPFTIPESGGTNTGVAQFIKKGGKPWKEKKKDRPIHKPDQTKGGGAKSAAKKKKRERDIKDFKKRGRVEGEWPPHVPSGV